jgi:hypothetical protein
VVRQCLRAVPIALALAAAGCSALSPSPDRSRFFFLTPVAAAAAAPPAGAAPLALGLAEVSFPAYLDRAELVTRIAANEIQVSATDRWAEPLAASFTRVLAMDLEARLATHEVVRSPWYGTTRLDGVLAVVVEQFEADGAKGCARLVARWSLRDGAGKRLLRKGVTTLERPFAATPDSPPAAAAQATARAAGAASGAGAERAGGPSPRSALVVAALSQVLADFSGELAAAVEQAVRGTEERPR